MHPRLRSVVLLSALLVALLALSGCGGGSVSAADNDNNVAAGDTGEADEASDAGEEAAAGDTVTVTTTEFAFDPDGFTLPADMATTVVLQNEGAVEHDITIEATDVKTHANATTTEQADVTLPAGDYVLFCSVPGHREAGMEGTVTVSG